MAETSEFDSLAPDDVHIEALEAYHLGGTRYSASFELSDHQDEFFRSFLLEVDCGASLNFRVRQQIEDSILSHASLGTDHHLSLELGRRIHELTPAGDTMTRLSGSTLFKIFRIPNGPQYVFGDDGACHMRDGATWETIPPGTTRMLNAVHGPSPDLVYACGNGGALLRLRGRQWDPVDLSDERDLTAIEVTGDNLIHLGGRGCALALREGELVELDAPENDFFSIESFKGRRYWGDATWGLNVQEGDSILPFRGLHYALSMHASPEKLVVAGWKEIFIFDGETWDGFQLGYDGNIFLDRLDMTQFDG